MASSSQSLDFSFDALGNFGSRLFRDQPKRSPKARAPIAAVITVFNFPAWASLRYRRQSRSWAFQAMSRIGLAQLFLGAEGDRDRYVLETGKLHAASINMRRAAPLPALVIPPWRRVLPLECSEGTRPR